MSDICDVTTLSAKELIQARDWLADCSWEDMEPEEFATLPEATIVRGIQRYFGGGIIAFKLSCIPS